MSKPNPTDASRRRLLRGIATGSAALLAAPAGRLLAAAGRPEGIVSGYGPLAPVADLTTGQSLLLLPPGFSYRTLGWTGGGLTLQDGPVSLGFGSSEPEIAACRNSGGAIGHYGITWIRLNSGGDKTPMLARYGGYMPGSMVTVQATACNGLAIEHSGTPLLGDAMQFQLRNFGGGRKGLAAILEFDRPFHKFLELHGEFPCFRFAGGHGCRHRHNLRIVALDQIVRTAIIVGRRP